MYQKMRFEQTHVYEWSEFSNKEVKFSERHFMTQWQEMSTDVIDKNKPWTVQVNPDELCSIVKNLWKVLNETLEHYVNDSKIIKKYDDFFLDSKNNCIANIIFGIQYNKIN